MKVTATPQVWIGCLAAYNEGTLHGEWVDAVDADEITEAKDRIIASSPAFHPEEWFIADYDGFGDLASTLGEYASFEQVAEIAQALEEHGSAVNGFIGWYGEWDAEKFEEAYRGCFDSERDFAYDFADQIGMFEPGTYGAHGDNHVKDAISQLETYFDWEMWTRDLFIGDFYAAEASGPEYGFHIFDRNV